MTDGGGVVRAALEPVVGRGRVIAVLERISASATLRTAQINGRPALIVRVADESDTVPAVRVDDGLVTGLYAVRNPEKLSRIGEEAVICR